MDKNDSQTDDFIDDPEVEMDIEMFMSRKVVMIMNRISANLLDPKDLTSGNVMDKAGDYVQLPTKREMLRMLADLPATVKSWGEDDVEPTQHHAIHMTILLRLLISLTNKDTVDEFLIDQILQAEEHDLSNGANDYPTKLDS